METQNIPGFGAEDTAESFKRAEEAHNEDQTRVAETFGTVVPENPVPSAPEPPKQKYAVSQSWSKGRDFKKPFDYIIESSGQEVKIRRLDMGDLLRLGIAEEMDFMTKALMTSDEKKTGGEAIAAAVMKAGNFDRMETMINKVVLAGLLTPKPHQPPMKFDGDNVVPDQEAKKDDILYIDDIPFADRMELFGVIFESDGLATFRGEQTASVGNVEAMSSVPLPAD